MFSVTEGVEVEVGKRVGDVIVSTTVGREDEGRVLLTMRAI